MESQYHFKALKSIDCKPVFTYHNHLHLPPSVAEWYSLTNGVELLKQYSNQDTPLQPVNFDIYQNQNTELIVFLYENQGVYWWAFENCEKDDPPVYINIDPPPDNWQFYCESFSTFVYTRIFDFLHWYDENLIMMGSGKPLDKDILDLLQQEYSPEPITYNWIGNKQYRFSHNDLRITIYTGGLGSSGWYFSANSPDTLQRAFKKYQSLLTWYIHPFKS